LAYGVPAFQAQGEGSQRVVWVRVSAILVLPVDGDARLSEVHPWTKPLRGSRGLAPGFLEPDRLEGDR